MRKLAAMIFYGAMALTFSAQFAVHAQDTGPDLLSDSKPRGTKGAFMNDNYPCQTNSTCNLLPLVSGSGYIDHLWTCGDSNSTVQVYVDGEQTPDINLSLPYLLGAFYSSDGQGPFTGRWITANGANVGNGVICGSMNLPIPFSTSILVTEYNGDSVTFPIASTVSYQLGVPNNFVKTHRLHIAANEAVIPAYGSVQFINPSITGTGGRLAGFSWLYDGYNENSNPQQALEGNFDIYTDGNTYSSSGTEDIFEMSFYFSQFTPASNSTPLATDNPNIGLVWHNTYTFSAWRFYIDDPFEFNNSLGMDWHCGQSGEPAGESNFTGSCKVFWSVYYYTST